MITTEVLLALIVLISCRDPHLGIALSLTGQTLEVRGSLQLGFHRKKA